MAQLAHRYLGFLILPGELSPMPWLADWPCCLPSLLIQQLGASAFQTRRFLRLPDGVIPSDPDFTCQQTYFAQTLFLHEMEALHVPLTPAR